MVFIELTEQETRTLLVVSISKIVCVMGTSKGSQIMVEGSDYHIDVVEPYSYIIKHLDVKKLP